MTDPFTQSYIALIEDAKKYARLPWQLKARIGCWLGRRHSFLLHREDAIVKRMQRVLGIDKELAHDHFVRLCESTGLAVQMVQHLPQITPQWIQRNVISGTQAPLEVLRKSGGLVLTHHSYHHNLLASCFKGWGITAFPVANPPERSGSNSYLHHFTVDLNAKTEANLDGGRFLYVDDARGLLRGIKSAVVAKQVIYVLCDFDEPKPSNPVYPFFDTTLQIPGGVLRAMASSDLPVYFAGFRFGVDRRYHIQWTALSKTSSSTRAVATGPGEVTDLSLGLGAAYVTALEQWVRTFPSAWQGWEGAA